MARIRSHVERCADFNRYQSSYRHGQSTDTTLLRMLDDVYRATITRASLLLQLRLSLDKTTLLIAPSGPHLRRSRYIAQVLSLIHI